MLGINPNYRHPSELLDSFRQRAGQAQQSTYALQEELPRQIERGLSRAGESALETAGLVADIKQRQRAQDAAQWQRFNETFARTFSDAAARRDRATELRRRDNEAALDRTLRMSEGEADRANRLAIAKLRSDGGDSSSLDTRLRSAIERGLPLPDGMAGPPAEMGPEVSALARMAGVKPEAIVSRMIGMPAAVIGDSNEVPASVAPLMRAAQEDVDQLSQQLISLEIGGEKKDAATAQRTRAAIGARLRTVADALDKAGRPDLAQGYRDQAVMYGIDWSAQGTPQATTQPAATSSSGWVLPEFLSGLGELMSGRTTGGGLQSWLGAFGGTGSAAAGTAAPPAPFSMEQFQSNVDALPFPNGGAAGPLRALDADPMAGFDWTKLREELQRRRGQ